MVTEIIETGVCVFVHMCVYEAVWGSELSRTPPVGKMKSLIITTLLFESIVFVGLI